MFMCAQNSAQARSDWSEIVLFWIISVALEGDALRRIISGAGVLGWAWLPSSSSWCPAYLPLNAGSSPLCPFQTRPRVAPQHDRAAASHPQECSCPGKASTALWGLRTSVCKSSSNCVLSLIPLFGCSLWLCTGWKGSTWGCESTFRRTGGLMASVLKILLEQSDHQVLWPIHFPGRKQHIYPPRAPVPLPSCPAPEQAQAGCPPLSLWVSHPLPSYCPSVVLRGCLPRKGTDALLKMRLAWWCHHKCEHKRPQNSWTPPRELKFASIPL